MAKRIKSINGYTIYQLTERDVNNEFYNATPGNYVIYLSSDIREYGRTNSTPDFEDIETLNECFDICAGSTAIAYEIVNDNYDAKLETIDAIETVINDARENNHKIYIDFWADDNADECETIVTTFKNLWDNVRDIRNDDAQIWNIFTVDDNENIVKVATV